MWSTTDGVSAGGSHEQGGNMAGVERVQWVREARNSSLYATFTFISGRGERQRDEGKGREGGIGRSVFISLSPYLCQNLEMILTSVSASTVGSILTKHPFYTSKLQG